MACKTSFRSCVGSIIYIVGSRFSVGEPRPDVRGTPNSVFGRDSILSVANCWFCLKNYQFALIREGRRRAGLTQRQLLPPIILYGVCTSTISSATCAKRSASPVIKQFASVLRVEADVLYFGAGRLPDDILYGEVSEEQVSPDRCNVF
jgi:hypothetical protein